MYKKITHNIVEEHYSSDAVAMHLHAPQQMRQINAKEYQDLSNQLKTQNKLRWDQICSRMRENIISIMSTGDDQSLLYDQLTKDVEYLLYELNSLYGKPAITELCTLFKNMLHSVLMVVRDIRANKDTKDNLAKLETAISEVALYLSNVNAVDWPASAVKSILTAATEGWIGSATARFKREWIDDLALATRVREILVTGTSVQNPSFADIMSSGIIRQFPMVFSSGDKVAK